MKMNLLMFYFINMCRFIFVLWRFTSLQVRKIGQANIAAASLALFTVGLLRRNIPLLIFSGRIFSQEYTVNI